MKSRTLAALVLLGLLTAGNTACASDIPTYFDYRLTNPTASSSAVTTAIIPAIRDQGLYNTCWSFTTICSLETSLNLKLQRANLPSIEPLSERYPAWLAYAAPLSGGGDGFLYPQDMTITDAYSVYNQGGTSNKAASVLIRYGTAYNTEYPYDLTPRDTFDMQGVSLVSRGAVIHDLYANLTPAVQAVQNSIYLKNDLAYYKQMIRDTGGVTMAIYANQSVPGTTKPFQDVCNLDPHYANHGLTMIGWDDSYVITDSGGQKHIGAWITRNSWGDHWSDTIALTAGGYFYISYDDVTAFVAGAVQSETDWGRYTAIDHVAGGIANDYETFAPQTSSYKTSDKLTSGASQILKAVGINVPADNMSYTIEVSLKGDAPANTTTIYTQSGTFGQDGTLGYNGYRTVDFDRFIYLPAGQNYFITVILTGADNQVLFLPIYSSAAPATNAGISYLYDAVTGDWIDESSKQAADGTYRSIPIFSLNKYSKEANGGDFTVVSLNDSGAGGSEIYLGKKDELYTTDLLHPAVYTDDGLTAGNTPRYTLSNMTVNLTKGLTDSVYGGKISGEGQVIKTGDGILALSGPNTYAGGTSVEAGSFALTGSLQSPVTVANGAVFTGYGTINGNLTNSGTLIPGLNSDARNLFSAAVGNSNTVNASQVGTLTVNGNFTSNGTLQIAVNGTNNSKLAVSGSSTLTGTSLNLTNSPTQPIINHSYNYLTSQGGITGNVNPAAVSPYIDLSCTTNSNNAYFCASQKQVLGSLPGMTASENSVGAALNHYMLAAVAVSSDSTMTQSLNTLAYQSESTSRVFSKQVTSEARAQLLQQSPLSSLTSETVYSRLDAVNNIDVTAAAPIAGPKNVADTKSGETGDPVLHITTPIALDAQNHLWLKLFKGYETSNYNTSLKDHSTGGAIGYDRALNQTTRAGCLFSYGLTSYSTDNLNGTSHDWRLGAYVNHKDGNWDYQGLFSYGLNHYDIDRHILADKVNGDYKSRIWDAEVKAGYTIPSTNGKTWQFTPYVKLSYTHNSQDAYAESGSSYFAQNINSASSSSTRGEVGIGFKRACGKDSSFGGSIGYKRVLSGANPELNGTFAKDTLSGSSFTIRGDNDRNFVTYGLNLHGSLGGNWSGQAELQGEVSRNTHKEIIGVTAKYSF